ncbi:hypothetical protein EX895_001854 [Sporisorium graminicola]|uniref:Uncharacterized protein n=1 Tax=Sporisorium graminicola TaxID=280036 RepID=A0A4U7KXB8_9BASI|nr:hypothetical protein EX895_001854 [Sporisorium graminicola]TKY89323.1 hypothetical protein EX895_001854 [Sporisorium graminicola]
MWFHPIPMILCGLLVLAALASAKPTVAVAFMDVKFDDKAAIWSLMLDDRYSRAIAITSGINAHKKAAQELYEYLGRQNIMPIGKRFDTNKLTILQGDNGLGKAAPHEEWWRNQRELRVAEATEATLRPLLRGNQVRVFQIAPTVPSQVKAVIEAADPGSIDSYMLLHGYNSRQINTEQQVSFLRSLQSELRDRNPMAYVTFTSSFDTYANKDGGKQPYTAIQHMFPKEDLDQAVKDPFWSGQILKAPSELKVGPFRVQDRAQLDSMIYHARMDPLKNKASRQQLLGYVQAGIEAGPRQPQLKNVLHRFENKLVQEFRGNNPVTLELADAAHIAAFHRHLDSIASPRPSGMELRPIKFGAGPYAENARIPFQQGSNWDNHGYLLTGADRDIDLDYIKRLAQIH